MCKLVDGGEFDVSKRTVASTKLADNDEVISVCVVKEQSGIVLRTAAGYFLRFDISEIPEKKKAAIGVRGMKLSKDDLVEEVYYIQNSVVQTITYKEKEIELNKLKLSKRDGKGVKVRLS
jgi:DNA gyrase subunit A